MGQDMTRYGLFLSIGITLFLRPANA